MIPDVTVGGALPEVVITADTPTVAPLGDADNVLVGYYEEGGKCYEVHEANRSAAATSTVTITVTNETGASAKNYSFILEAQSLSCSGGHNHDVDRPRGAFHVDSDNDGIPDTWQETVDLTTDDNGQCSIIYTYRTSGIGGVDEIIAKTKAGAVLSTADIYIRNENFHVNQMNGLTEDEIKADPACRYFPYAFTGATDNHPENHWGPLITYEDLANIAINFKAEYPDFILRYNDISLECGGPFDIRQDMIDLLEACAGAVVKSFPRTWNPPHQAHR